MSVHPVIKQEPERKNKRIRANENAPNGIDHQDDRRGVVKGVAAGMAYKVGSLVD
jgi:hypothetical protein